MGCGSSKVPDVDPKSLETPKIVPNLQTQGMLSSPTEKPSSDLKSEKYNLNPNVQINYPSEQQLLPAIANDIPNLQTDVLNEITHYPNDTLEHPEQASIDPPLDASFSSDIVGPVVFEAVGLNLQELGHDHNVSHRDDDDEEEFHWHELQNIGNDYKNKQQQDIIYASAARTATNDDVTSVSSSTSTSSQLIITPIPISIPTLVNDHVLLSTNGISSKDSSSDVGTAVEPSVQTVAPHPSNSTVLPTTSTTSLSLSSSATSPTPKVLPPVLSQTVIAEANAVYEDTSLHQLTGAATVSTIESPVTSPVSSPVMGMVVGELRDKDTRTAAQRLQDRIREKNKTAAAATATTAVVIVNTNSSTTDSDPGMTQSNQYHDLSTGLLEGNNDINGNTTEDVAATATNVNGNGNDYEHIRQSMPMTTNNNNNNSNGRDKQSKDDAEVALFLEKQALRQRPPQALSRSLSVITTTLQQQRPKSAGPVPSSQRPPHHHPVTSPHDTSKSLQNSPVSPGKVKSPKDGMSTNTNNNTMRPHPTPTTFTEKLENIEQTMGIVPSSDQVSSSSSSSNKTPMAERLAARIRAKRESAGSTGTDSTMIDTEVNPSSGVHVPTSPSMYTVVKAVTGRRSTSSSSSSSMKRPQSSGATRPSSTSMSSSSSSLYSSSVSVPPPTPTRRPLSGGTNRSSLSGHNSSAHKVGSGLQRPGFTGEGPQGRSRSVSAPRPKSLTAFIDSGGSFSEHELTSQDDNDTSANSTSRPIGKGVVENLNVTAEDDDDDGIPLSGLTPSALSDISRDGDKEDDDEEAGVAVKVHRIESRTKLLDSSSTPRSASKPAPFQRAQSEVMSLTKAKAVVSVPVPTTPAATTITTTIASLTTTSKKSSTEAGSKTSKPMAPSSTVKKTGPGPGVRPLSTGDNDSVTSTSTDGTRSRGVHTPKAHSSVDKTDVSTVKPKNSRSSTGTTTAGGGGGGLHRSQSSLGPVAGKEPRPRSLNSSLSLITSLDGDDQSQGSAGGSKPSTRVTPSSTRSATSSFRQRSSFDSDQNSDSLSRRKFSNAPVPLPRFR
eukprot:gene9755-20288_t